MGVSEIWRWDGKRVTILRLRDGEYDKVPVSASLPLLSSDVLNRFMTESRTLRRTDWIRQLREWARSASAIS